jgi:Phosphodiester glycosidase
MKTSKILTPLAISVAFVTGAALPLWAEVTVTSPYQGITRTYRTETLPRPQNINVVEIDLTNPNISFKLSPGNPPTDNIFNSETRGQTTLDFLLQEQAQLAVNVHFFDFPLQSNGGTNLTGFAASQGNVYSAFDPNPVLNFALLPNATGLNLSANNQAQIVNRGDTTTSLVAGLDPVMPYNTLTGSAQIITNGVKTLPTDLPPRPNSDPPVFWYTDQIAARTAIGLSQDSQKLIVFTVDAAGGSVGMTVDEVADFLISQYGVYNALNLDGGGSTTLALRDPLTNTASVINAASGGPRAVGSSLAVFVKPIPEPAGMSVLAGSVVLVMMRYRRRGDRRN